MWKNCTFLLLDVDHVILARWYLYASALAVFLCFILCVGSNWYKIDCLNPLYIRKMADQAHLKWRLFHILICNWRVSYPRLKGWTIDWMMNGVDSSCTLGHVCNMSVLELSADESIEHGRMRKEQEIAASIRWRWTSAELSVDKLIDVKFKSKKKVPPIKIENERNQTIDADGHKLTIGRPTSTTHSQ